MADPPRVAPAWTIRRAGPADGEHLVELHRRYCAADGHDFDADRARAGFGPLLADDRHGVVWLAAGGPGADRGYAVVTWGWSIEGGGAEALLDEIFADPPGRGAGSALVGHLLDDCRRRGMRRIFLETERVNGRARALYGRLGFSTDDSVWMSRDLP